jgi:hypothetical protein
MPELPPLRHPPRYPSSLRPRDLASPRSPAARPTRDCFQPNPPRSPEAVVTRSEVQGERDTSGSRAPRSQLRVQTLPEAERRQLLTLASQLGVRHAQPAIGERLMSALLDPLKRPKAEEIAARLEAAGASLRNRSLIADRLLETSSSFAGRVASATLDRVIEDLGGLASSRTLELLSGPGGPLHLLAVNTLLEENLLPDEPAIIYRALSTVPAPRVREVLDRSRRLDRLGFPKETILDALECRADQPWSWVARMMVLSPLLPSSRDPAFSHPSFDPQIASLLQQLHHGEHVDLTLVLGLVGLRLGSCTTQREVSSLIAHGADQFLEQMDRAMARFDSRPSRGQRAAREWLGSAANDLESAMDKSRIEMSVRSLGFLEKAVPQASLETALEETLQWMKDYQGAGLKAEIGGKTLLQHAERVLNGRRRQSRGDLSDPVKDDAHFELGDDARPVDVGQTFARVHHAIVHLCKPEDRFDLMYSLVSRLADCIDPEDLHRVCEVGITERLLETLEGYLRGIHSQKVSAPNLVSVLAAPFFSSRETDATLEELAAFHARSLAEAEDRFGEGSRGLEVFQQHLELYLKGDHGWTPPDHSPPAPPEPARR